MIICLETATNLCSVALIDNAGVVSLRESTEHKSHASQITVFADEMLRDQGMKASDLNAVAVSKGPGSYTGLRIGVSVAKGIAYGAAIPLIGVETTLSMFWGMKQNIHLTETKKEPYYCPMLDARRMEVYYAIYDSSGNKIKDISARVVTEDLFADIPESQSIIFFGDGAKKCKDIINHKNATFAEDFRISAAYMHRPVIQALNEKKYEDVAYFEPFYLKDFITTVPRKNVLGK
jgi:tRNA threonylcarbamoyladenosine biosynthesis protein TsaB